MQISETYDWRLAVPNMEKRDSYFTRLKWRIELTHHTEVEKVSPSNCKSTAMFRFLQLLTPGQAEHPTYLVVGLRGSSRRPFCGTLDKSSPVCQTGSSSNPVAWRSTQGFTSNHTLRNCCAVHEWLSLRRLWWPATPGATMCSATSWCG